MTVNELAALLDRIPKNQRDREVRLWLPGSQLTIDGSAAFPMNKAVNGRALDADIWCIEGNLVEGSALCS